MIFWLEIMVLIWLFLLGWAHIVSGHFSPVEIAMTLVVGVASATGVGLCLWRAPWSLLGCALFVLFGILQVAAFRISFLPGIAHQ